MSQIFNAVKGLITPDLISNAASFLGEDKSKVTAAVGAAIPGILGSLLAKGESPEVESALLSAGKENDSILSGITDLFSGKGGESTSNIGSQFLSSILGNKLGGFSSLISAVSGITSGSAGKLVSLISPVIAGFLGNKLTTGGLSLSGLLGQLGSEKSSFANLIPSGLSGLLGVPSFSGITNSISSGVNNVADSAEKAAKSGLGWLKWLIPLLALLAIFLGWRSCQGTATDVKNATIDVVDDASAAVSSAVERISTELTLPGGLKLQAFKGGIEDQLITFIGSDDYKNASDEQLKNKWFNFDNIEFKHGSATELTEESYPQLNNIVAILKEYKDAKVKVGGYTDKTGSSDVNLKLSQERANTIKDILSKGGVGEQVVGAEGYGDQFAVHSADAPDSERALDRKIALRFVK